MCLRFWLGLLAGSALPSFAAAEPDVTAEELPRLKPLEPARAVESFALRPGLKMELAAAEPEVSSPIAISFDESGALFVCEMRDYPLPDLREKKLGRIKRLEDRDGDGRFESAGVFLADLPWPTGLICSNGGVVVLAAPDLIFARDTNGDGVADERKVIATGFGAGREKLNVQALPNSLTWGPDGRIWGATAGNGGAVGNVRVDGADFSLDAKTFQLRAESGTAQYGLTFDAEGQRFVCSNSRHLQWVAWERWQGGNLAPLPPALIDIAEGGPAAPVFRISPDEPWRVVRTRWRASGLSQGIVEGGGRVSGYFTSATGLHCYLGDALPPEFRGNFFVGDVGSNLVHRKIRGESAGQLHAQRAADEQDREFLASRDNWFRPVSFADGPDGALYVVDMYREVIEHPDSLPPAIKKHLDLTSGAARGRLWRVTGNERPTTRKLPAGAATAELVAMLESPNGWHRSTAQRLLCEQNDPAATGPLKQSKSPLALAVLALRKQLTTADVRRVLEGAHAGAKRLAVRFLSQANDVRGAAAAELRSDLLNSSDEFLLVELASGLGTVSSTERLEILRKLHDRKNAAPRLRQAVVLALRDANEAWSLAKACDDADLWSLLRGNASLRGEITAHLSGMPPEAAAPLWVALGARPVPDNLLEWARRHWELRCAVSLLVLQGQDSALLEKIVVTDAAPIPLRREALAGLAPDSAAQLCTAWSRVPAALRAEVLEWCLRRPDTAEVLLGAIEKGQLAATELSVSQTNRLRSSGSDKTKALAVKLLGPPPPDRQQMIAQRQPALKREGDAKKGEVTFRQRCLQCHRHGAEGSNLGPDRVTFRNLGKPTLLANLLDPNREVAPAFSVVTVETTRGETFAGLLMAETPEGVTLKTATAQEIKVPRGELRRLDRVNRSLMPEGLETGLTDQDLADLLQFLVQ